MGRRAGVCCAMGAVPSELQLMDPLLLAAVHWDFALHHPGLPAAHHSPVLPGVHPGELWGTLGMTPGRGVLPAVLRVVAARCACQPGSYGQAIGHMEYDCSKLSGQCVLGLECIGVPPWGPSPTALRHLARYKEDRTHGGRVMVEVSPCLTWGGDSDKGWGAAPR